MTNKRAVVNNHYPEDVLSEVQAPALHALHTEDERCVTVNKGVCTGVVRSVA